MGVAPVKEGVWLSLQSGKKSVEIINSNLTKVPSLLFFYNKKRLLGYAQVETATVCKRRLVGDNAVEAMYLQYENRLGMLRAEVNSVKWRNVVTILRLTGMYVFKSPYPWPARLSTPQSGVRFNKVPSLPVTVVSRATKIPFESGTCHQKMCTSLLCGL